MKTQEKTTKDDENWPAEMHQYKNGKERTTSIRPTKLPFCTFSTYAFCVRSKKSAEKATDTIVVVNRSNRRAPLGKWVCAAIR